MDLGELIARAAPACPECGEPVQRVEIPWQRNGDGDWTPDDAAMVCALGHRTPVELIGGLS